MSELWPSRGVGFSPAPFRIISKRHESRAALDGDPPVSRLVEPPMEGEIVAFPKAGGLTQTNDADASSYEDHPSAALVAMKRAGRRGTW